jgi:hypothetical protein
MIIMDDPFSRSSAIIAFQMWNALTTGSKFVTYNGPSTLQVLLWVSVLSTFGTVEA